MRAAQILLYLNGNNMEKVLVINGCSHSVGSEISGQGISDSRECRDKSFGALLAQKLDRKPIHLALPAGSNDRILRTTLAWIGDNIDAIQSKKIDPIFLIHWTGTQRSEFRVNTEPCYTPFVDHRNNDDSYRPMAVGVQSMSSGVTKKITEWFNHLFVYDEIYWTDNKLKNILALQGIFKSMGLQYWFGDSFDAFSCNKKSLNFESVSKLVNRTYFPYFDNLEMTYYWYCKNEGFKNIDPTHQIWHLGADAHTFYSEFLVKEFQKARLTS